MTSNARHSGSAHRGLNDWLWQRLSALYLSAFSLWLLGRMILWPIADYVSWKAWLATGSVRTAFALFFLCLLVHAWIGMRSVFLDYLKPFSIRFAAQLLLALGLISLAFWAAQILIVDASA